MDEQSSTVPSDVEADPVIPGRRFIERFERRAHVHRLHPSRMWRLLLGLGILAFGIVNVFIPGPGGSVLILAALLVLAGESRLLARLLDWCELRFERQIGWMLRHKLLSVCLISGSAFLVVATGTFLLAR